MNIAEQLEALACRPGTQSYPASFEVEDMAALANGDEGAIEAVTETRDELAEEIGYIRANKTAAEIQRAETALEVCTELLSR